MHYPAILLYLHSHLALPGLQVLRVPTDAGTVPEEAAEGGGGGAEHWPGKEFLGLSLPNMGKERWALELIPGCPSAGLSSFPATVTSSHPLHPQAPGRSQRNRSVFVSPGPLTVTAYILKRPRETKPPGLFLDLRDRFF